MQHNKPYGTKELLGPMAASSRTYPVFTGGEGLGGVAVDFRNPFDGEGPSLGTGATGSAQRARGGTLVGLR